MRGIVFPINRVAKQHAMILRDGRTENQIHRVIINRRWTDDGEVSLKDVGVKKRSVYVGIGHYLMVGDMTSEN